MNKKPKLTLTPTVQKVYDFLNDQLTTHGNISITRVEIARVLNISLVSAKRATDFITLNSMKPYGLKDINTNYIGNLIVYSYDNIQDDIDEIDVHIIQLFRTQYPIGYSDATLILQETELEDYSVNPEYSIKQRNC